MSTVPLGSVSRIRCHPAIRERRLPGTIAILSRRARRSADGGALMRCVTDGAPPSERFDAFLPPADSQGLKHLPVLLLGLPRLRIIGIDPASGREAVGEPGLKEGPEFGMSEGIEPSPINKFPEANSLVRFAIVSADSRKIVMPHALPGGGCDLAE